MPFIPMTPPQDAHGKLKEEYARIEAERGAVGSIFRVTGAHPGATTLHLELYKELVYGESPLSRRERELVATVVSRANDCQYCIAHHADAFGRHANEPGLQALVATDYTKANLSARERALADHAVKLTKEPSRVTEDDVARVRKVAGLDDRAVLDLTLVVAYFNFVNRLANGLGLTPQDLRGPYKY